VADPRPAQTDLLVIGQDDDGLHATPPKVDLEQDKIRFCTLRRKDPVSQPQLREVDYRLPNRGFQD
jgi:hypothetical protein